MTLYNLYNIFEAWLLSPFAISASKHGGQLANGFFIYSKLITLSPGYLKGWRIFTMTAVHPRTKNPFKNSCSRQYGIVNTVVTSIASRSDRLTETCFYKEVG